MLSQFCTLGDFDASVNKTKVTSPLFYFSLKTVPPLLTRTPWFPRTRGCRVCQTVKCEGRQSSSSILAEVILLLLAVRLHARWASVPPHHPPTHPQLSLVASIAPYRVFFLCLDIFLHNQLESNVLSWFSSRCFYVFMRSLWKRYRVAQFKQRMFLFTRMTVLQLDVRSIL